LFRGRGGVALGWRHHGAVAGDMSGNQGGARWWSGLK